MRRTLAAAALAAVCGGALAQGDSPSKPVRLVVGFAAGGISDVLARALVVKLGPNLGQQVIVDNKPGAGTTIAADPSQLRLARLRQPDRRLAPV
jgi:tripartite-type tricarboxylate transporter receptor subunit TctC